VKQSLAEFYRKHRKGVNENLGLFIALAACGAAMWTGYEARRARFDAASIADQSLKVQHDSVEAQITAMRVDQRPFIRVVPVGVKAGDGADSDMEYRTVFKLVSTGRTPATFVKWDAYCDVLGSNQIAGVAQTEKEAMRMRGDGMVVILGETGFTRTTGGEAVLNNGDSIQVDCPFSKKAYRSGTDDVDIDAEKQTADDKS